jgi:AI-2 transport protein TqsA
MNLAIYLVIAASSWYLLTELAPVLRPLLLAVLLCYIILPIYHKLKAKMPPFFAFLVMIGGTVAIFAVTIQIVQSSINQFAEGSGNFQDQVHTKIESLEKYLQENVPWLANDLSKLESETTSRVQEYVSSMFQSATSFFLELMVVLLYLSFALVEASKFPQRVRKAFQTENAERIGMTIEGINEKIAQYLIAKVESSLLLAIPIYILFMLFGIKLAMVWALLTFLCNFIPYLGTLIANVIPGLFILLDLEWGPQPFIAIICMMSWHLITSTWGEPYIVGNAVGLSPIVILLSLTFWGLCWGFGGMLLAVPLTVMIKIIMENIPNTASAAKLLGD